MNRIVWSAPSLSDLDSIHNYISLDSPDYADAVILEILDSVGRLASFPDSGRLVPEVKDGGTREIIVGNCRVVYSAGSDGVHILTILHGARKFHP